MLLIVDKKRNSPNPHKYKNGKEIMLCSLNEIVDSKENMDYSYTHTMDEFW